jgi:nitrite reductase (NADH) small subunit
MSEWVEVGHINDIPVLGSRVFTQSTMTIAIFRTADDQFFALDNRCPHRQGPLSEGIVHGTKVTCPLHNWIIDLKTGDAQSPDVGCTKTIPLRLDNGVIHLKFIKETV